MQHGSPAPVITASHDLPLRPPSLARLWHATAESRDQLTARLREMGHVAPADAEQRLLDRWKTELPPERWGRWLTSWARTLSAYGTPMNFTDSVRTSTGSFRMLGMEWKWCSREGGNYEMRRELTARQRPYQILTTPDKRDLKTRAACVLCENVLQGVDSENYPDFVPGNIMLDMGEAVLVPNRYPATPLHMMWLPKNHDDESTRVAPQRIPEVGPNGVTRTLVRVPKEEGKTRGRLVTASELEDLFSFAATMGLVAVRNHPLSGMSIPGHDHWHLIPIELFPDGYFDEIAFGSRKNSQTPLKRALGSPFEVKVSQGNPRTLATELAGDINTLERRDQVFSPVFVPLASGPIVLLAPLDDAAVADTYVQVGGAVPAHDFPNGKLPEPVVRCAPTRFIFDWRKAGVQMPHVEGLPVRTPDEIVAHYSPIDYAKLSTSRDGSAIRHILSPAAESLYDKLLHLQDKRDDPGHVNTVIYFSHLFATLQGLSEKEIEANVLAAILHDAGWSSTPNINTIWNELASRVHGEDAATAKAAKQEMYKLRWGHQLEAARLAREHLQGHPYLDRICDVVDDHDTRTRAPEPLFRAFLDGDWMWRVTRQGLVAGSAGNFNRHDPDATFAMLKRAASKDDFQLPWVYPIARLETANTVLAMKESMGWDCLPKGFGEDFSEELRRLRGGHQS